MILVWRSLATLLVVDGDLVEHGRVYLREGLWVAVILNSTVYISRKAKKASFRGFFARFRGCFRKVEHYKLVRSGRLMQSETPRSVAFIFAVCGSFSTGFVWRRIVSPSALKSWILVLLATDGITKWRTVVLSSTNDTSTSRSYARIRPSQIVTSPPGRML